MHNPCMCLKLFESENAFNRHTLTLFVYAKAAVARMWVENLRIVWALMCWSFTCSFGNAEKLCYSVWHSRPHSSNNGSIWIAGLSGFLFSFLLTSRRSCSLVLPLNWTVSNFVEFSVSLWLLLLWFSTLLNET